MNLLVREYDSLDRFTEENQVDQTHINMMNDIMIELSQIWALEETKAR